MTADLSQRHAELVREIRSHDHRYYVLDNPLISDQDYDALYRQLVDLEAAHPQLATPDSPTQRVGGSPRGDLKSVEHVVPMTSLDNTYTETNTNYLVIGKKSANRSWMPRGSAAPK